MQCRPFEELPFEALFKMAEEKY
jgi:tetratricopeptide (TPR) repeat protein